MSDLPDGQLGYYWKYHKFTNPVESKKNIVGHYEDQEKHVGAERNTGIHGAAVKIVLFFKGDKNPAWYFGR